MAEVKVWEKEKIAELVQTNDRMLYESLTRLYDRQTDAEKNMEATVEHNGVGFNGVDGKFLSSLAKSYRQYGRLTDRQKAAARKSLKKYTGQITRMANEYEEIKAQQAAVERAKEAMING